MACKTGDKTKPFLLGKNGFVCFSLGAGFIVEFLGGLGGCWLVCKTGDKTGPSLQEKTDLFFLPGLGLAELLGGVGGLAGPAGWHAKPAIKRIRVLLKTYLFFFLGS